MSYLIISDSSSNLLWSNDEHYRTVPLHVMIDGHDWADTADLDINKFDEALDSCTGPVSTACPSPDEWLSAFGDAEEIYCFTISRNLSGSFNSALAAKRHYEDEFPDRHVYIIDTFSAGCTAIFMMDELKKLLDSGIRGEEAVLKLSEFRLHKTALTFTLQSIKRLAAGGRVNPILVKAIGVLDLRIIGTASDEGKIQIAGKHRGAAKVLKGTFKEMLKLGYNGGRVIIAHNRNIGDAEGLKKLILERFGEKAQVMIMRTTALCSFYAEKYGYIVGFDIDGSLKERHFILP